ncbi:hypothetical protein ACWEKT_15315 [Nocardia takedensis]
MSTDPHDTLARTTHVLADHDNTAPLVIAYAHGRGGELTVDMTVNGQARERPIRISVNGTTIARREPATRECACPITAASVLGGVHVRHGERCLRGEPRRYLWRYAGALHTGSLADYAAFFDTLDPEDQHRLARTGDELRTWTATYRLHITTTLTPDHSLQVRFTADDEWSETLIHSPA